ncbi:NAD(P)-binding protein [Thozetella sp. PMI_491]|nr:NAD(P)-binding protein [Thozetella sp. PMI_491]
MPFSQSTLLRITLLLLLPIVLSIVYPVLKTTFFAMSIQNVVIVGGSGNLGSFVLKELLAAGFNVTALTRESSNSTFPAGVTVKKADYDSIESVQSAFAGQDAVVSVVGTLAIRSQTILADAALAAGVKRFIPSEFGINTRKLEGLAIGKILVGKTAFVDYLDELAKKNPSFSWTGVSTGFFFDYGIKAGILINYKEKSIAVVDSGDEKWPASTLSHIGKVVAGILKHPDQTANKYLETASFNLSQNELLAIVEELTGTKYTVKKLNGAELLKTGEEKLAKGDFSAFFPLLQAYNSADGAGHAAKLDNALVGVPEEDLKAAVKDGLTQAGVL